MLSSIMSSVIVAVIHHSTTLLQKKNFTSVDLLWHYAQDLPVLQTVKPCYQEVQVPSLENNSEPCTIILF